MFDIAPTADTLDHIATAISNAATPTDDSTDKTPASVNVIVAKQRRNLDPINPFVILFYQNFDALLVKYPMSPAALRVLVRLLKLAAFGNLVCFKQTSLAADLGISKAVVSRTIALFLKCGILTELENGGIFLNPQVLSKGSLLKLADNHDLMTQTLGTLQAQGMSAAFGSPAQLKAAGIV
jgi:hypothetical protein